MKAVIFYIHIAIISTLPMVISPIFNCVSFICQAGWCYVCPQGENQILLCFTSYFACFPSSSSFFFFGYTITHHLFPLYCSFRGRVLRGLYIFIITFFWIFKIFMNTTGKNVLIQLHVGFLRIQMFYTFFFQLSTLFIVYVMYDISDPVFCLFFGYVTSEMKEDT